MKRFLNILFCFVLVSALTGCGAKAPTDDAEPVEKTQAEPETVEVRDIPVQTVELSEPEETPEEKFENRIAAMNFSIPFGDISEEIGSEQIREWIKTENGQVISVDEEAVKEYVKTLSRKYDTFGISRSFKTHEGNTITVTGGDFGWWMDRVSTSNELIQRIKDLEGGDFEPVYFGTGLGYGNSENDIGNSYVEINLDAQHLYVYQNGSQVEEADFVSGCLMKGNGTPTGTYGITYKERDATLVGENYSSAVSYWMPFNGNVGMHDARWRNTFGGTIYYMDGSHGCINLPKEKAEKIYGIVEKGEPVVVYGSVTKEQAAANLTDEQKLIAIQKGYIPITDEMALAFLLQQQAAAGLQGTEGQPVEGQPQQPQEQPQQPEQQAPAEGAQ